MAAIDECIRSSIELDDVRPFIDFTAAAMLFRIEHHLERTREQAGVFFAGLLDGFIKPMSRAGFPGDGNHARRGG